MNLYLLTPPAVEPVEPDDAKLALRIDGTEFDALLPSLIVSARQVAEQEVRQGLRHRARSESNNLSKIELRTKEEQ